MKKKKFYQRIIVQPFQESNEQFCRTNDWHQKNVSHHHEAYDVIRLHNHVYQAIYLPFPEDY